jgi:predicted metal-dependent phosphoesterase TrpH
MGLADLHIHTTYSWDGTATAREIVLYASQNTDLDVIAITDHDTTEGALQAADLAAGLDLEVITGCEIATSAGHLQALFIQENVPAGLSLVETIMRVGELGGLCVIPHPLANNPHGISEIALRIALRDPEVPHILVGVEAYNAGLVNQASNAKARVLGERLGFSLIGGSDSHMLWTIGKGATAFAGNTAADLRHALETRATVAVKRGPTNPVHLIMTWLGSFTLRRMGISAAWFSS